MADSRRAIPLIVWTLYSLVPVTQSGRNSLERMLTGFVLDLQLGFHLCKMNQSATKKWQEAQKINVHRGCR
jgi:hypothetical protein